MTTHTGPRLQDIHARMAIGELDHLPRVDPMRVADHRQLISECDVDVAEGILRQLRHLSRRRIRPVDLTVNECLIEIGRRGRGVFVDPADDPVVVDQLNQNAAGKHPFGAMRQPHASGPVRTRLLQDRQNRAGGGSHRDGGFNEHEITGFDVGRDTARRRFDIGDVRRLVAVVQRRRHRDNENIRRLRL